LQVEKTVPESQPTIALKNWPIIIIIIVVQLASFQYVAPLAANNPP